MFKGALYLLSAEHSFFIYRWKDALLMAPAMVKAQHSDKESVVELIKEVAYKVHRSTYLLKKWRKFQMKYNKTIFIRFTVAQVTMLWERCPPDLPWPLPGYWL